MASAAPHTFKQSLSYLQFDLFIHGLFITKLCIHFYYVQARYYGLDTYS